MTINYPTYLNIVERSRADVTSVLPQLDPTIETSFINAIITSTSGRSFDLVTLLEQLERELFPQTAGLDSLLRWAGYEGLSRFAESQAQGAIVIEGTANTIVPAGTTFRSDVGNNYTTDAEVEIITNVITVTSITRLGSTAIVTTSAAHNFATNTSITIAGANETEYNITASIVVTSTTTFTYQITGLPNTPASGTITATSNCINAQVTSTGFGTAQNLLSGARLTLTQQISGINNVARVGFEGVTGGTSIEDIESLRTRTLQSRANPVANFNVAAIERQALLVQGVTRVRVKRVTPSAGMVTILFVRDGDSNIIPDSGQVTAVKNSIIQILPATSDESDVIVLAPVAIETDFNFSAISPDTPTMREAIQANIRAMYEDEVTFETTITEIQYDSAIINTVDPDTGNRLTSFTLASPSGDIVVGDNQLGTLGEVIFL